MNKPVNPGYIPVLDGLRALSILLVFVSHQAMGHIVPGGFGVTIFFFISGFLITNLLFAEYNRTHTIGLKNFYIRRLLRLYPALLLMIIVLTAFYTLTGTAFKTGELLAALFYYENYYLVFAPPFASRFSILWSLAVEEHFYLVFPCLFLALAHKPRTLLRITAVLALLSLAARGITVWVNGIGSFSSAATYNLTLNRFDSILYGCLLSMLLHSPARSRLLQLSANKWVYATAACLLLLTFLLRDELFRQTIRYSLQGWCMMVLLPPLVYSLRYQRIRRLLSVKPLVFIGKISYSVYLFHFVAAKMCVYLGLQKGTPLSLALNSGLTIVLSLASYYWVEIQFNNLRRRFGSHMRGGKEAPVRPLRTELPQGVASND